MSKKRNREDKRALKALGKKEAAAFLNKRDLSFTGFDSNSPETVKSLNSTVKRLRKELSDVVAERLAEANQNETRATKISARVRELLTEQAQHDKLYGETTAEYFQRTGANTGVADDEPGRPMTGFLPTLTGRRAQRECAARTPHAVWRDFLPFHKTQPTKENPCCEIKLPKHYDDATERRFKELARTARPLHYNAPTYEQWAKELARGAEIEPAILRTPRPQSYFEVLKDSKSSPERRHEMVLHVKADMSLAMAAINNLMRLAEEAAVKFASLPGEKLQPAAPPLSTGNVNVMEPSATKTKPSLYALNSTVTKGILTLTLANGSAEEFPWPYTLPWDFAEWLYERTITSVRKHREYGLGKTMAVFKADSGSTYVFEGFNMNKFHDELVWNFQSSAESCVRLTHMVDGAVFDILQSVAEHDIEQAQQIADIVADLPLDLTSAMPFSGEFTTGLGAGDEATGD